MLADRQGRGHHRHLAARAGPRDGLVADRRRPARGAVRGRRGPARRHPDVAVRGLDTYGSRSLVVGGEALVLAADKVIEKAKPIAAHMLEASADDLEFSAGRFQVQRHRQGRDHPGGRHRGVGGARPARGRRAQPRRLGDLRPGQLLLPARHAPVRDGGRHRDRPGDDAQVRLRRRHRQHRQPAHRRGSGPRRPGAGHRPGVVGGGGVRRQRAPWCPGRSWTTCCRRPPTRSASTPTTPPRRARPTRSAPRA